MEQEIFWFVFQGANLLLLPDTDGALHVARGFTPPLPVSGTIHRIGTCQGLACAAYATEDLAVGWTATELRASYEIIGPERYGLAGRGFQLIHWDGNSRYCPVCGAATQPATWISKVCPDCGKEIFPVIATAVLALVQKGDSILLARGRNFKLPFFSILAGFLEPGETLEECVRREVLEETGLIVENVTYFGSQPWPFPSGLMVGFFADYRAGDITLQEDELIAAGFYSRDKLPMLPHSFSLSRRMIDAWLAGRQPTTDVCELRRP